MEKREQKGKVESAVIHALHAQNCCKYRKENVNRFSDDEK